MSMARRNRLVMLLAVSMISVWSCQEKKYRDEIYEKPKIHGNPEIRNLSPEESLKKMYLPKGYRIELVATEPMINEPVAIAWDGNGKCMWHR